MENVELPNRLGWSILGGVPAVPKLLCPDNRTLSYRSRLSRDSDPSCPTLGGVGISQLHMYMCICKT